MYAHQPGPQASQKARSQAPGAKTVAAARPVGPRAGRAANVLALQRLAGNAAVGRLIAAQRRDAVQAALSVQGRGLAPRVRADMEARLGADLSGVRVHTGSAADRAARAVSAEAFTTGSHLVFRRGRYNPSSTAGRRVLAHELVHVLQQRRGPVEGTGGPLKISDPADRFERAAESTARRVAGSGLARPDRAEPAVQPSARSSLTRIPVLGQAIQRAAPKPTNPKYGRLTSPGGCGTSMSVVLEQNNLGVGSSPSVKPPWWPSKVSAGVSQATVDWFKRFMVQGHLLNDNVGGPGNDMRNLTPLTKRANSLHHSKVERDVKDYVLIDDYIVKYDVTATYDYPQTGANLTDGPVNGKVEKEIDANFADYIAEEIKAKYKTYDKKGNLIDDDGWEIENTSSR